ncbi:MAG: hypothetical protein CVU17_01865 [Betaproteobacteria bacterium HGW-Betaproteobacteria-11]|nr:MAG: hypothetical protein CVU17_01865 [Betaproteobacteria bacterium HGW-Betaproteobacteria-11]
MSLIRGLSISQNYRRLIYAAVGLVALSGLGWIALGFSLDAEDFSDPLRLWRHRLLVVHGCGAYLLLWLAGSLFPQHQWGAWKARRNRGSGTALSAALFLLAASGLLLYYPAADDWHNANSFVHQIIGGMLVFLLPLHIILGRRRRHASADFSKVAHGARH